MPEPLLRWIEDDLAFTASALEELGFRLDRYRYALLKVAAFDHEDAPLDREAQLVGILGVAVELIEDAHGILRYRRPESQLDYPAGDDEPVGGLEASSTSGAVAGPRDLPRLAAGGLIPAAVLDWIERDTLQTANLIAELLWPLFPIQEALEDNGTSDGDTPLDLEAQLAGFVTCTIDNLEDVYELLSSRRPLTLSERLAEAALE